MLRRTCIRCHASKIKCELKRPCNNCNTRRVDCLYKSQAIESALAGIIQQYDFASILNAWQAYTTALEDDGDRHEAVQSIQTTENPNIRTIHFKIEDPGKKPTRGLIFIQGNTISCTPRLNIPGLVKILRHQLKSSSISHGSLRVHTKHSWSRLTVNQRFNNDNLLLISAQFSQEISYPPRVFLLLDSEIIDPPSRLNVCGKQCDFVISPVGHVGGIVVFQLGHEYIVSRPIQEGWTVVDEYRLVNLLKERHTREQIYNSFDYSLRLIIDHELEWFSEMPLRASRAVTAQRLQAMRNLAQTRKDFHWRKERNKLEGIFRGASFSSFCSLRARHGVELKIYFY